MTTDSQTPTKIAPAITMTIPQEAAELATLIIARALYRYELENPDRIDFVRSAAVQWAVPVLAASLALGDEATDGLIYNAYAMVKLMGPEGVFEESLKSAAAVLGEESIDEVRRRVLKICEDIMMIDDQAQ